MGLVELTELLKSGGPYALTAISLFVAGFLYRGREADRQQALKQLDDARKDASSQLEAFRQASREEHEAKNNKLFGLAERMAAVIAQTDKNQGQLADLVKELLREIREMRMRKDS